MKLIGLHGPIRSGKDTVADWLCARHAYSRMAIAGPIKDALVSMLRLPRFEFEDVYAKEQPIPWLGKSPRQLMQTLGTEWGRQIVDQDFWLKLAEERVRHYRKFTTAIVVTDVRFENEAAWIRRQGGAIWHILRPAAQNVVPLHASETPLPIVLGVDSVIDNSAGLEQLRAEIGRALTGDCIVVAPAA